MLRRETSGAEGMVAEDVGETTEGKTGEVVGGIKIEEVVVGETHMGGKIDVK